jgi:hypothetical protein
VRQQNNLLIDKHKLNSFKLLKQAWQNLHHKLLRKMHYKQLQVTQAVDPTTGLGSFQPFLTKAATAADAATGLTGPMTAAQTTAYTSPFQQQVIDTTLAEFDKQAKMRQKSISSANIRCTWCIWWWP